MQILMKNTQGHRFTFPLSSVFKNASYLRHIGKRFFLGKKTPNLKFRTDSFLQTTI